MKQRRRIRLSRSIDVIETQNKKWIIIKIIIRPVPLCAPNNKREFQILNDSIEIEEAHKSNIHYEVPFHWKTTTTKISVIDKMANIVCPHKKATIDFCIQQQQKYSGRKCDTRIKRNKFRLFFCVYRWMMKERAKQQHKNTKTGHHPNGIQLFYNFR